MEFKARWITESRGTFHAESEIAAEQQRQGWQVILNNFARHAEDKAGT